MIMGETICAAAIAAIFNQPFHSVSVSKISATPAVYKVAYKRQSDGSYWDYKCRVEGNRVFWGAPHGRWRDKASDGKTTFSIKDDRIFVTETYSDGSSTTKDYPAKQVDFGVLLGIIAPKD